MFSCFCGRKKPLGQSSSIKKHEILASIQIPKTEISTSKVADEESTVKLSKNDSHTILMTHSKNQSTEEAKSKGQIKQIQSVKQLSNQSGSILNSSFSSDSDTVPYQTRMKNSSTSTARLNKFSEKRQKLNHQFEIKNFRTINDNPVQRICTIDKNANLFRSGSKFHPTNNSSSIKIFPTVDYSKYSEVDMKVGSGEILDLDQEMQNKLVELQHKSFAQQRHKSTASLNRQNPSQKQTRFVPQVKKSNRKKRSSGFSNIESGLDDLGRVQDEIQHSVIKSSKGLSGSKALSGSNFNSTPKYDTSTMLKDKEQDAKEIQKRKQTIQFVEKTVKSQLDIIIAEDIQDPFFCTKQSIKSPQSLDTFKKFVTICEIPQLQQTLEEAQNSFHCDSINEQFSRALITKHFHLACSIFEKMTFDEKNSVDPKGYTPVHLTILNAIVNDKCFDLAKKIMYHPEIKLNVKGPTGWSPLQETISYVQHFSQKKKHIRLSPNVFVAAHRKKINLIRKSLAQSAQILANMKDFQMCLDVKVDSFIPLVGNLTPSDTITITKIQNQLLINYTLVGYEFLSCKRRDMGFLINGETILAINRSKGQYCDILEQLDKQEIQMLVVQSLQCQTKKIDPLIKNFELKEAKTLFDNEILDKINNYQAKKYIFSINYTSMTEKRMPQKPIENKENQKIQISSPLSFLSSWQLYKKHENKVNIKPKNKNKKIELQMWLSEEFSFKIENLIKIFELFALSNPLAKTISDFLTKYFNQMESLKEKFPVKIDVPINFSLYFNLEFRGLQFDGLKKEKFNLGQSIKKISRKQFQKISESKEKRAFAISAFT